MNDFDIEFHMFDNGGVIIKDADGNTVELNNKSMEDLNTYYSWGGWNTYFNDKHMGCR